MLDHSLKFKEPIKESCLQTCIGGQKLEDMIVAEIASMDIALSPTSTPEGASPIYLLKRLET